MALIKNFLKIPSPPPPPLSMIKDFHPLFYFDFDRALSALFIQQKPLTVEHKGCLAYIFQIHIVESGREDRTQPGNQRSGFFGNGLLDDFLDDALRNEATPSLIWADLLDLLAEVVGKVPP